MYQINGTNTITVLETILFCPDCRRFYITQAMSRDLVNKYPGYYVDLSFYTLKPAKKLISNKKQAEKVDSSQTEHQKEEILSDSTDVSHLKADNNSIEGINDVSQHATKPGLNVPVFLSNTYAPSNSICPLCRSALGEELVNIPVIDTNGDFYRYYSDTVRYCYKCRKAYISKDKIKAILRKVNSSAKTVRTVKLENATISRSEINRDYLFLPTLSNSYAVFFPDHDYKKSRTPKNESMDLNSQSFLGEMGYSVNKSVHIRHYILIEAIKKYGKRKVSDHIAFLIVTRKAQTKGESKYANAIHIWQQDLNFISEVQIHQSQ